MKKRPKDPFQLAKLIGDIATGQVKDKEEVPAEKKKEKDKNTKNKKE